MLIDFVLADFVWHIQTQKSIIISVYYLIDLLIRIVIGIGCVF